MTSPAATSALLAALLALARPAPADEKEEVRGAAKKATELGSYTFHAEMSVEGGMGVLGSGAPPAIDGKFQKDVGTLITIGDTTQLARKGDKAAVKRANAGWQDLSAASGRQTTFARGLLGNLKVPHEELKDFESVFKEIKKSDRKETVNDRECAVYSGDLTEEAARKLNPISAVLGRFRNMGFEMGGSAKVWIDGDGALLKYEVTTTLSGNFQGQEFEVGLTRTIQLSKLGDTQVEFPDDARKLLEK